MDKINLNEVEALVSKLENIENYFHQLEQCRILAEYLQEIKFPDDVDPADIEEAAKELEPVIKMICETAAALGGSTTKPAAQNQDNKPTAIQEKILEYLSSHNSHPASLAEISEGTGLTVKSVGASLARLLKRGNVSNQNGKWFLRSTS